LGSVVLYLQTSLMLCSPHGASVQGLGMLEEVQSHFLVALWNLLCLVFCFVFLKTVHLFEREHEREKARERESQREKQTLR